MSAWLPAVMNGAVSRAMFLVAALQPSCVCIEATQDEHECSVSVCFHVRYGHLDDDGTHSRLEIRAGLAFGPILTPAQMVNNHKVSSTMGAFAIYSLFVKINSG